MHPHTRTTEQPVEIATGGARGIGRSTVDQLGRDRLPVVFTHSNSDADAEKLESEGNAQEPILRGVRHGVTDDHAPRILDDQQMNLVFSRKVA